MNHPKKFKGIALNFATARPLVNFEWAMAINALAYPVGMNHEIIASVKSPKDKNIHTRALQRQLIAERSIERCAEFIMSLDDDTVPPADTIPQLIYIMNQHPNAAIVGGIYTTKETPEEPLVFQELGAGAYWDWTVGDVFPCAGLGLGCMLIRSKFLGSLSKPWFLDASGPGQTGITDDLYLCRKVVEAGYEIWAHGGVLPDHLEETTDADGDPLTIAHRLSADTPPWRRYHEKQKAKVLE